MATAPETGTPLRGLVPFSETEQGVLFGRDDEREALARLVCGRGFRAGLLYGPAGVGKTSLLRAGLIPHLRAQDIVALYCGNIRAPIAALAQELAAVTGISAEGGEAAIAFLDRTVTRAITDRQIIFVLDDVEVALGSGDERLLNSLGELFSRVVTRAGGRARFLFCCASENVHQFTILEQRTGSLFPPSSRYQLAGFDADRARVVLDRMLTVAPVVTSEDLASTIIAGLTQDGPILPIDLQVAAVAVCELGITTVAELQQFGSNLKEQMERAWLNAVAASTGNKRAALRLMAELAGNVNGALPAPNWLAARLGIEPHDAVHAMAAMAAKGLLCAVPGPENQPYFTLAHPILRSRVREVAAPALAAARRSREMLVAKANRQKPLSPREYRTLRIEGIVPATPQERAVVERTKRLYTILAGALVAVPVLLLLSFYIAMSGRYYLDVATIAGPGTGGERLVVRAGRPALDAFNWLPAEPQFGSVVADSGFSRAMVQPALWDQARANELTGDLDDDSGSYAAAALAALTPELAALVDYATTGSDQALTQLRANAGEPQDLIELLESLGPVARGSSAEIDLVEQALNDASPAVQASALSTAAQVAKRHPGRYHEPLVRALTATDDELRRLAFAAVRDLGQGTAQALLQKGLAQNPSPEVSRELLAELTDIDTAATPTPAAAVSILSNRDISQRTRQDAREVLQRAFTTDPEAAARAAAELAGDDNAQPEDRVLALTLMRDFAPAAAYADIAGQIGTAVRAADEGVRAAALPLYARMAPQDAAAELAIMLEDTTLSESLRVALALAWGALAKNRERAARVALETLVEDPSPRVRAAAAEAYGNVGRGAQGKLIDMLKTARFDVAVGAAMGLANSVEVGAPAGTAMAGINQMWRRKGRPRRAAARVMARMARTRARTVYSYLVTAVRTDDDRQLRLVGASGLCSASVAGHRPARRMLVKVSLDSDPEVRRVVMQCVADTPFAPDATATIAARLARDGDARIRADAARALEQVVASGTVSEAVVRALTRLLGDAERKVRVIAARGLARLGAQAPEDTGKALLKAYDRADEGERQVLLDTARAIGSGELVPRAIVDASPAVRVAALDAAISTGTNVAATMNAAFTDNAPEVRRAALTQLGARADQLDPQDVRKALRLALRDPDPTMAQLALTTLVRLGDRDAVVTRLRKSLGQRSEQARNQAAAASVGLVARDPAAVVTLLEPLLDDPSHDVRVAMLPPLAMAYAATQAPQALAEMLRAAETHAMQRLVATAALLVLARTDTNRDTVLAALEAMAQSAPPMAAEYARLGRGLLESNAAGIAFLTLLVP